MLRTLYREASSGDFSVSTLSTTARPARSRATCATWGAAIRHGPHHDAQKSTRIGTLLSRTISSNSSGPTSMGSAIAGSGVLQAPHLPLSARCFAGIRFGFPQDEQFRRMAMAKSLIEVPHQQYRPRGDKDKRGLSPQLFTFKPLAQESTWGPGTGSE